MERENGRFYSREELYELVWSTAMAKLREAFGISDVSLAKKCKKLGIPTPERGCWARVASGQSVDKGKLPPTSKGQANQIWIAKRTADHADQACKFPDNIKEESAALKLPEDIMKVRPNFKNVHPLTKQTRSILRRSQEDVYGRLFRPWNEKYLSVSVSRENLDRTLLIFDSILSALEHFGFEVKLEKNDSRPTTYLIRGGVQMSLRAFERAKRRERKRNGNGHVDAWWDYDRYEYKPSGEIEFQLERWPLNFRRWTDLKSATLENRLSDIVSEIIASSEQLKISRIDGKRKRGESSKNVEIRCTYDNLEMRSKSEKRSCSSKRQIGNPPAGYERLSRPLESRRATWMKFRKRSGSSGEVGPPNKPTRSIH